MITIREFNLTEGRERGPLRGSTKALKYSGGNKPSRVGYFPGNGRNLIVESSAGFTPNSKEMLCGQHEKC